MLCETLTELFEMTPDPPVAVPTLTEVDVTLWFTGSTVTEVVALAVVAQSPVQFAFAFAFARDLPSGELEKLRFLL